MSFINDIHMKVLGSSGAKPVVLKEESVDGLPSKVPLNGSDVKANDQGKKEK